MMSQPFYRSFEGKGKDTGMHSLISKKLMKQVEFNVNNERK